MAKNFLKIVLVVLAMGTMATVAGCGGENRTQTHLMKRANAYWEARRINDLSTIYSMEAETAEGHLTPDRIQKAPFGRIQLVGYTFRNVKIDDNLASMTVDLQITIPELEGKSVAGPSTLDRWTFVKGDWYHGGISPASNREPKGSEPAKAEQTELRETQ
jgi:hypothetical protein